MVEIIYNILDKILAPLTNLGEEFTIIGIALIVSFIFAGSYKVLVNKNKMKEVKRNVREIKEEMNEAKKKGDSEKFGKLSKKWAHINQEQMMLGMKPLFVSLIPTLFLFLWLKDTYTEITFNLPFVMPIIGNTVGWLGFYIIVSIPSTFIFRKILEVD